MFSALLIVALPATWQSEAPEPFDATRQTWNLALVGTRVDSLPQGNWIGGTDWTREGVVFRSSGTEQTVACQALDRDDFETNDLRFRLGPDGASVQIGYASDVRRGALQDVGGVACLVSNGTDTVLEYEVYGIYGGYHVIPYCGVFMLHGRGGQLASDVALRPQEEGRSPLDRFVQITSAEDQSESRGYLDEFGRKQGVWTVREPNGRRAEFAWRDGIPHGSVLGWDEKGRLRTLRDFRRGIQEEESMDWTEAGELRSRQSFVRGQAHGRRLVFHPSGTKAIEMEFNHGSWVGTRRNWSETGALIEEEEAKGLALFGSIPAGGDAARTAFLTRFEALHTRPNH